MSRTYQTRGIILKGTPFGETDRLLTLFSPDHGLIRAIAPGARKPKSSLRGRTEIFVVNQFLLATGKSLDRILQVETQQSFSGLGQDACTLAAGQYLIEVILALAVEQTPQPLLYELFIEHLRRLEVEAQPPTLYAHLAQGLFHCLALEGFAPQLHHCALSGEVITPNFHTLQWRMGFSHDLGGVVTLPIKTHQPLTLKRLTAIELSLLQHLSHSALPDPLDFLPAVAQKRLRVVDWLTVERVLRDYAQHQLGKTFKAAPLVDSLWELDF
ncbi:MAG: DNA repair protein RecO [Synechocystis sp.]|nr:DNA repair protein RecO [Synechocystis sp.]